MSETVEISKTDLEQIEALFTENARLRRELERANQALVALALGENEDCARS